MKAARPFCNAWFGKCTKRSAISCKPDRFEHLASFSGLDPDVEGGTLLGEFFVARDVPADALLITEGSLFIAERDHLLGLRRLAPTTQFAL